LVFSSTTTTICTSLQNQTHESETKKSTRELSARMEAGHEGVVRRAQPHVRRPRVKARTPVVSNWCSAASVVAIQWRSTVQRFLREAPGRSFSTEKNRPHTADVAPELREIEGSGRGRARVVRRGGEFPGRKRGCPTAVPRLQYMAMGCPTFLAECSQTARNQLFNSLWRPRTTSPCPPTVPQDPPRTKSGIAPPSHDAYGGPNAVGPVARRFPRSPGQGEQEFHWIQQDPAVSQQGSVQPMPYS
jgi:hypothetical protein